MQPPWERDPPPGFGRVMGAWRRLSAGWRVASAVAFVWLLLAPLVATAFFLSGNPLPTSARVIAALSRFLALGVIIGAVREHRRNNPNAYSMSRARVAFYLAILAFAFVTPLF